MPQNCYRAWWIAKFEAERDYFAEDTGHFDNWERRGSPDVEAEIQLGDAQAALFGGGPQVAEKFLRAAIEVVDRGCAEDKFQSTELARAGFPRNRAEALRIRAYARGLKDGAFDRADLLTASGDYEERASGYSGADWDSQAQAYYLNGVRTSLIAGDIARAQSLLQTKRSFKWHAEEHSLLKELTNEAQFGAPIRDDKLRARVLRFFDWVRDPDVQPDVYLEVRLVRLEWGALVNKYFETGSAIDWNRVVELVSK